MPGRKLSAIMTLVVFLGGLALGQNASAEVPAEWQAMESSELVKLAQDLAAQGKSAEEQRQLLEGYISEQYFSSAARTREISPRQWSSLVKSFQQDFTQDSRSRWLTALKAAFVNDDTLLALDGNEALALGQSLSSLGDAGSADVLGKWASQSAMVDSFSSGGISTVASRIKGSSQLQQAGRKRLVDKIDKVILKDAESVRKVKPQIISSYVRDLNSEIGAESKSSLAERIWAAYLADPQACALMDGAGMMSIGSSLRGLGHKQALDVPAVWINSGGKLETVGVAYLGGLLSDLQKVGENGAGAYQKAMTYAIDVYGADADKAQLLTPRQWQSVLKVCRADLDELQKNRVAAVLKATFAADTGRLAEMPTGDVRALELSLAAVSETSFPSVLAEMVDKQDGWRSWTVQDMLWLARQLNKPPASRSSLAKLGAHLVEVPLSDPETTIKAGVSNWRFLATLVGPELPIEQRERWARSLTANYLENEGVKSSLTPAQLKDLAAALSVLSSGEALKIGAVAGTAEGDSAEVTTSLATVAAASGDASRDLLLQFEPQWDKAFQEGKLSWQSTCGVAEAWIASGDKERGKRWTERAYGLALGTEEMRAAADMAVLRRIGILLRQAELIGPGRGYEGYVQVMRRLAVEGKLPMTDWRTHNIIARGLGTPETQQMFEELLHDEQGHVRIEVANILTWSYRKLLKEKHWEEQIDEHVKAANGDAKAKWLMVKAYSASIRNIGKERLPLDGKQHLDEALAISQSESCRLLVLSELVEGFSLTNRYEEGLSMLESISPQFSAATAVEQIEQWRSRLEEEQRQHLAERIKWRQEKLKNLR